MDDDVKQPNKVATQYVIPDQPVCNNDLRSPGTARGIVLRNFILLSAAGFD